jgi:DNA-binding beta-propeller fold protein YncE
LCAREGLCAARALSAPRRAALAALLTLSGALLAAGALPAPAFAVRGHEFAGAFGWGVRSGALELQRCQSTELPEVPPVCLPGLAGNGPGQFEDPEAIAVNEATGHVYVVDKANDRVEIFNASGTELEGEFNGSGTLPNEGKAAGSGGLEEEVPSGQFDEPEGIAVDNSCVLRHLSEAKCKEEDPSNGDVYVVDTRGHKAGTFEEERQVIDKFGPGGEYLGQITRNPTGEFPELGFRALFGVAVDQRGGVWVEEHNFGTLRNGAAHYANGAQNEFIEFHSTENVLLSSHPAPGLAVDAEGDLYVHNTFGSGDRLAKFRPEGEPAKLLSAELDEEAPSAVALEASGDESGYIAHAGNVHRIDASGVSLQHPGGVSLETLKAPGTPSFSGVAVNSQTLTVYAADTAASRIDVFTPESPGAPRVEAGSESVADVSASSASFGAEVNPRSEENEAATTYAFSYGPCASVAACPESPYPQSIPSPEGTLAPNYEPDPISAHPQDLLPHTVYHMRVLAQNSHGQGPPGEELIFTTQGSGAGALPDQRHYELVSPPDKKGAVIPPRGLGSAQAAQGGDVISYLASTPSEAEPKGYAGTEQVLSRRGPSSWESQDIATPHEAPAGASLGSAGEYLSFSDDLASALAQPAGPFTQATSPQASEQTLYLRRDFPAGDPAHPCGSSCYRPLVSGCPGGGEPCPGPVEEVANVPEGTKFGEGHEAPTFLGASPDMSHVVLSSGVALTEGSPEGGGLYEWSAGRLALVSVLAGGEAAPGAELGFYTIAAGARIARHALSSDGQRVVFSGQGEERHLYLRDMSRGETIELDTPEASCTAHCKGSSQPIFQTASADGSRVFFTDSQPLTQGAGGADLYECEIEGEEEEPLRCKLNDLAPEGEVLGLVAGASEDGSAIYFTANAKLSAQPSASGEEAVAGDCEGSIPTGSRESETAPQRCDLYLRSAGQTKLVAVLSGADFPDWSLRGGQGGGLGGLTDRVSPDGRYLAFSSRRSLSGYDNRDAQSNKPDQEIFLYDSSAGTLRCASCDPSGARPRGVQYKQIEAGEEGLAGASQVWPQSTWVAASTPGWSVINDAQGFALYQSRYLNDAGRLFFNSADALVSQDANKTEDVYEYEPPGIGDCSKEQATFAPSAGGCVALISSGTAKEESAFLDASESGDDAFFLTGQRLLPSQDLDTSLDIYDAHVCGAGTAATCLPEAPTPAPACEGDACQSPGSPPESLTPGSLTYQGPGNPIAPTAKPKSAAELKAEKLKQALKACHKQKAKRKRAACEARARKLYGAHKAKKAAKRHKKPAQGKRR